MVRHPGLLRQPQPVRRRRNPAGRRRHLLPRQRPLREAAQGRRHRLERARRPALRHLRQAGAVGTRNDLVANVFAGREAQQSYVTDAAGARSPCVTASPTPSSRRSASTVRPAALRMPSQGRLPPRRSAGLGELRFDGQPARSTEGVRLTASATPYAGFLGSDPSIFVAKAQARPTTPSTDEARYILAGRIGFGSISGANLEDIPANIRFFAAAAVPCGASPTRRSGRAAPSTCPSAAAALLEASLEARIKVTDTIGVVPFIDAGTAFAGSLPDFRRAHPLRGGPGPSLLHRHRPDPRRCRLPDGPHQGNRERPVALYISLGQSF